MIALWILGGGGHARMVIDAARSAGHHLPVGILDDRADAAGHEVDGVPVAGPISPEAIRRHGIAHAVIAIGDNSARAAIAERLDGLVTWETVIHARAYVAASASVDAGSVVVTHAVVQPGTVIGRHAIINTAATVDHDITVERYVHIAPGCHLASGVAIGEGAFMGIGSSVIPSRRIGAWSVVGAGAAVVGDVPANVTAIGVPARVIAAREEVRPW